MADPFPPASFVPTQSGISGIETWMPASEEVEHRGVVKVTVSRFNRQQGVEREVV